MQGSSTDFSMYIQKDTADGPRSDPQLEIAGYFHKDSYPQPSSIWKKKKKLKKFYTDQASNFPPSL